MNRKPPHGAALRKGRYSAPGQIYFITTNVAGRRPLLVPSARDTIIQSLRWLRDDGRIWLLGYVIMSDHLHTLVLLRQDYDLSGMLNSLKRHTARQINLAAGREGPLWQEGYHDHGIRDKVDFWHHFHYMHNNPVRRGWVERA